MTPVKPTSTIVFGILNIAFGILGLCGLAFALIGLSLSADVGVYGEMMKNPIYRIWGYASVVIGGVLTIVLISAGALLLAMKREGRILSIWYAIAAIVMTVLGAAIQAAITIGPALNLLTSGTMNEENAAIVAMAFSSPCSLICNSIYPGLLLYFMTRPHIKAAFEPAAIGADPQWYPPQQ